MDWKDIQLFHRSYIMAFLEVEKQGTPPPPPALISVCPAFNSSVCLHSKPGRPECQNDSQCPKSKKCCCSGNCGVMCVTPEKVRAGRCPDIKAKCRPEPTYNCTTDSDCPGSQKCCNICGRTCWNPEPELKGTCPKNDGAQSDSLQCSSVKCSRNSDCKTREKCCPSGDGQSCVNAQTGDKEGSKYESLGSVSNLEHGQEQVPDSLVVYRPGAPDDTLGWWVKTPSTGKKPGDLLQAEQVRSSCQSSCADDVGLTLKKAPSGHLLKRDFYFWTLVRHH
ncbi:PREDICTED: whey acidic protein-like [Nanorana parkeri]|uniref:whey acidic protein-like n=1 Tax=Nanorana parkeri TaxID=125878 RepID=UPI000854AAE5|nr:PREDICTED: whey acidic protein-like [Nanorana parkeri]